MTTTVGSLPPYDAAAATALMKEFDALRMFSEVEAWDARAAAEIKRIAEFLKKLSSEESRVGAAERHAQETHASKSLLRRALSSPPDAVAAAAKWREEAGKLREVLLKLSEQLEAAIDKTPNSPAEQKEMLQELKQVKKELGLQKREANEAMRQIRTSVRQRTVKVGVGLNALFTTPTTRRWTRLGLRLEKEAAVAPHETAKTRIQRNLLVVEKAILWVGRFK